MKFPYRAKHKVWVEQATSWMKNVATCRVRRWIRVGSEKTTGTQVGIVLREQSINLSLSTSELPCSLTFWVSSTLIISLLFSAYLLHPPVCILHHALKRPEPFEITVRRCYSDDSTYIINQTQLFSLSFLSSISRSAVMFVYVTQCGQIFAGVPQPHLAPPGYLLLLRSCSSSLLLSF